MRKISGWFKIWRQMCESKPNGEYSVFDNPYHLKVWLYILAHASHEEKDYVGKNGKKYHLKEGQLFTSLVKLSEDLKMARISVLRILETLSVTNMVTKSGTRNGTLLSVVRWGLYQNAEPPTEPKSEPQSVPKSEKRRFSGDTLNKNYITRREEVKIGAGDFSDNKPPKIGDIRFKQFDQYGNEWWERCENIRTSGYENWKSYVRWELEELQQRKGGVMPWDVGKKKE